ncbi:MAG: hypothetical protein Q8L10_03260 [Candidatus Moranbacteria bacterium]|nr:hypothetical protein [Candidatus Moranbacteria bacterium]
MQKTEEEIIKRLKILFNKIKMQKDVSGNYASGNLSFDEEMQQIQEYIDTSEYGIAYENIVTALESHPFALTGRDAVVLLELGLLFKFKTDRSEDNIFKE